MTAKEKRDRVLYNLLPGEREKIRAHQGGKDPITGEPLKDYANLDHCHRTGQIRGLLNPMTNKHLNDNLQQVLRTAEYLMNPPAVAALGEIVYGLMGRAKSGKRKPKYGPDGSPTPRARARRAVAVQEL